MKPIIFSGPMSRAANPLVAVYDFKKVEGTCQ